MPTGLKEFERKSQLFVSIYQELVDEVVGGQRRTTLNSTADEVLKKTPRDESEQIFNMIRNIAFNLGVDRDDFSMLGNIDSSFVSSSPWAMQLSVFSVSL